MTSLVVGSHVLSASFDGNASYAASSSAIGPNSIINSVVGGGAPGDGGPATAAQVGQPEAIAVDSAGDVFIADVNFDRIREIVRATGVIITVAGNGSVGYSGDGGPAIAAEFVDPQGIAVDSAGDLFIADTGNNRIREVNASTHIITTVAGGGSSAGNDGLGDGGPATAAQLSGPEGIAVDSAGDLFIADASNNRIREVNASTQIITTVAGSGTSGFGGDGLPATSTAVDLESPSGVAVDSAGDIFIADTSNDRIREVNASTTVITTVAGNGTSGFGGDGLLATSTAVELGGPQGIAVDSAGDLFIADTGNSRIREVNASTHIITTVAGGGDSGLGDGGLATAAELSGPFGVALDSAGDLFIADTYNFRVREVNYTADNYATSDISTVAGGGGSISDGSAATQAYLSNPYGVATDSAGDIFIADTATNRIREVNVTTGIITTVAGGGNNRGTDGVGDGGPATAAELNLGYGEGGGVAVDSAGDLFIADSGNNRIREVNASTHIIITVAGNGTYGFGGDGLPATAAELGDPRGVALDSTGDLFIADSGNGRIREVNATTGTIVTVAGDGYPLYNGDNIAATAANLATPTGIALDSAGDIFFADTFDFRIREVNASTGLITTVAGDGVQGYGGDNIAATATDLFVPDGVAVDALGDVFIADEDNRVREVVKATGIIITVAGTGNGSFGGDGGPAGSASVDSPSGVAIGPTGNLLIADTGNNRIREINYGSADALTVAGVIASIAPETGTPGAFITNSNSFALHGFAVPDAIVTMQLNGTSIGAATAAGNGAWTFTDFLASGTYSFAAIDSGPGGFQETITQSVTVEGPPPAFSLSGPASGTYFTGQTVAITWVAAGVDVAGPTKISLGYDADPVAFDAHEIWIEIDGVTAANGAGSYSWNTTGVALGTYYLSGYMYDFSASTAVFSSIGTPIVIAAGSAPTFALTGPSAGTFSAGASVGIQWTAAGVDVAGPTKISLGYDADPTPYDAHEHWIEIDGVTAANGAASYNWNTTSVAAGTYYLSGYMYDFSTSRAVFSNLTTTIVILPGAPIFTLLSPSAGTFSAGTSVTIQWSAGNVDVGGPAKISLGYDPDVTPFDANEHWIEVDGVTAANSAASYVWNTTSVASGTYYLSGYMYDFSNGQQIVSHVTTSFVITGGAPPAFTLLGPSAGTFAPGANVTIKWSATPFDSNEHWFEIDGVTAANGAGSYVWNTGSVAAGTYYLSGYMYDFSLSQAVYSHLGTSIVIT